MYFESHKAFCLFQTQVVSATAAFMIIFTSSITSAQFIIYGFLFVFPFFNTVLFVSFGEQNIGHFGLALPPVLSHVFLFAGTLEPTYAAWFCFFGFFSTVVGQVCALSFPERNIFLSGSDLCLAVRDELSDQEVRATLLHRVQHRPRAWHFLHLNGRPGCPQFHP